MAPLNVLAAIRSITSTLDTIKCIVKLNGWVASAEGFTSQPQVMDGASLLLEEIFGEAGKHARAAIGVAELPLGAPLDALRRVQMDIAAYARLREVADFFSPHLFCLGGITPTGRTFARHFGLPPDC